MARPIDTPRPSATVHTETNTQLHCVQGVIMFARSLASIFLSIGIHLAAIDVIAPHVSRELHLLASMLEDLKQRVCQANLELVGHGLVKLTWGKISGLSSDREPLVIRPSDVVYGELECF